MGSFDALGQFAKGISVTRKNGRKRSFNRGGDLGERQSAVLSKEHDFELFLRQLGQGSIELVDEFLIRSR
jgi:hypothetical protein